MAAKFCAYALLLLATSAAAAPCYSDGDVVTLEGTATRQAARSAESSAKPVWVLSLVRPICVTSAAATPGQNQQGNVGVVQIIDTTPPENARLQLTGKLVTGNVSEYYAVPTAIWVLKQRVLSAQ